MNLSDGMKLTFIRGEWFHMAWNLLWRKHSVVCDEMHAETQMKRKKELADKADWIWDAIDAAECLYDLYSRNSPSCWTEAYPRKKRK